ncbi:hypothetical protein QW131_00830 [Roseibium salinum]|nr:hypothetical protein [Roseibium salinum]
MNGRSSRPFSGELARNVAREDPDNYVATMSKARRKGRIFIDYLRNERGSTAIAPVLAPRPQRRPAGLAGQLGAA